MESLKELFVLNDHIKPRWIISKKCNILVFLELLKNELFGFWVKILLKGVGTYSRLQNKSIVMFTNSWIFYPKGYVLILKEVIYSIQKSIVTKCLSLMPNFTGAKSILKVS